MSYLKDTQAESVLCLLGAFICLGIAGIVLSDYLPKKQRVFTTGYKKANTVLYNSKQFKEGGTLEVEDERGNKVTLKKVDGRMLMIDSNGVGRLLSSPDIDYRSPYDR